MENTIDNTNDDTIKDEPMNDGNGRKRPFSSLNEDDTRKEDTKNDTTMKNETTNDNQNSTTKNDIVTNNNNRNRPRNIHYENAYRNFYYTKLESTGRPGTPHRYFDESYLVSYNNDTNNDDENNNNKDNVGNNNNKHRHLSQSANGMIVHKHVNGLVIITAGNKFRQLSSSSSPGDESDDVVRSIQPQDTIITKVTYNVQEPQSNDASSGSEGKSLSANATRKQQAAMLKGKIGKGGNNNNNNKSNDDDNNSKATGSNNNNKNGIIRPDDTLITIELQQENQQQGNSNNEKLSSDDAHHNGATTTTGSTTLPCCVWGTIIEINSKLLLQQHNRTKIQREEVQDPDQTEGTTNTTTIITTNDWDNDNNNISLLHTDPLLSGYIAIVRPTGPFPPNR